jgi:hypothetical protein
MTIPVTITCVHCGKAFATYGTGSGRYGAQHPAPTFGKTSRVYFKFGQVQRTEMKCRGFRRGPGRQVRHVPGAKPPSHHRGFP